MSPVIASVPSGHVYVRHLAHPDGNDPVTRLPDPRPRADVVDAQWWPPRMLEPGWVDDHADEFDLMHVHFGFDATSPADLRLLRDRLRHHGRPLVLTVHDLRNPHHHDRGLHDSQLDVLVEGADALITLTEGAAREIATRWGRTAVVVPHPHVVAAPLLSRPRPDHDDFVIGVHAKSLRAGMNPLPAIEEIVATLPALPGARLQVDAHTDVMTADGGRYSPDLAPRLHDLAAKGLVDLQVHDYFSDDELWDYLQSLDVSVLPYRFGTHSGWLEACHDLGTTVLAPDCGYYADQRPCLTYAAPGVRSAPHVAPLSAALTAAWRERPVWRADPRERRRERLEISRTHQQVYAAVLADARRLGVPCAS